MDRRAELLYLARRARVQWINDAADPGSSSAVSSEAGPGVSTGIANEARSREMDAIRSSIGSIRCLDEVLRFLTEVSGDGDEAVSLEALLLSTGSTDAEEGPAEALPQEPYAQFIHKLKLVSSAEVVKFMHNFVINLESDIREAKLMEALDEPKLTSVAQSIWAFLRRAQGMVRESVAWAEETPEQWEQSKASLETFIQTKLHRTLFLEDARADAELHDRIQSLKFITPEHLDVKAAAASGAGQSFDRRVLSGAVEILISRLDSARCPLGKVDCLKDCSAAIFKALQKMHGDSTVSGADDFLPLLILVLIEANPRRLKSNLKYIQTFVNPAKLVSEAGYILTQFVSAVHFLDTVDASALTISPLEFETAMARCRALAADESNGSTATYHDLYDYHYTSTGRITTTATSSHYPTDDRRGSRHLPSVPQVSPGLLPPRPRKERSRAAVEYVSARAIYAARCSSTDGDVTGRTSSSHSESNRGPYRGGDIAFSKATGTSSGGYDTALSDAEFRAFRSSLARALDRWDARLHSSVARAWAGTDARTSLYRIEPTSASSSTSSGGSTSSSISTSSSGGMAVPQSPLLHYVYSEPETLSLGDIPRLLSEYKLLVKVCSVLASESQL